MIKVNSLINKLFEKLNITKEDIVINCIGIIPQSNSIISTTNCNYYKINFDNNIKDGSIKWSLIRGNRTGRTAWQYIINLASENNLKLNF